MLNLIFVGIPTLRGDVVLYYTCICIVCMYVIYSRLRNVYDHVYIRKSVDFLCRDGVNVRIT